MSKARLWWFALPLALAGGSLSSACDVLTVNCTLIGCEDRLTIELAGTLPEAYTVTATAPGEEPRVVECPGGLGCSGELGWGGFTPERVTVRLESADGVVERTFTPRYFPYRPNGRDCEPECLWGRVVLDVGAPGSSTAEGARR